MIVGLFRRSAKGFGFVRPHTSTSKTDHIYIPVEATRDASSGDEVAVKITKRSRREGMNVEGRIVEVLTRASGIFRRDLFRGRRHQLRQDRRHHVSRADLGGRSWRQGGQARRQGGTRDRPLSDALSRRGGGHHRDPRPARAAGGRHVDDHSCLQHSRYLRRRSPRRGPRTGQAVQRSRDRHARSTSAACQR